jgi:hypothetical protein
VQKDQISLVKQENSFYKKSISSLFEMLSLRLGEERKKSFFLEKDVLRLRSDIQYLEKMSQGWTTDRSLAEIANKQSR